VRNIASPDAQTRQGSSRSSANKRVGVREAAAPLGAAERTPQPAADEDRAMQYTVIGDANQCAVTQMTSGDEIHAEVGAMVLLSDGITLEAASNAPLMRVSELPVLNAAVPLTTFRCMGGMGVVAFAAPCSGEVRHLDVRAGAWFCARDSFLFCSRDVIATIGLVQSVEEGQFREGGFVLYRLSGHGEAYVHCGGNTIEYELAPGQRVSVDAGCVAAYQETVQSTIEAFDGLPSTQGGSESLFLMTLTGPGKIYLATLPLSRIAKAMKGGKPASGRTREIDGRALGHLVREL
jgi:uncharacterized protein (AIM24 family)